MGLSERIRSNSLFLKVIVVAVLSICIVFSVTLGLAIRASEEVYVDTFSRSTSQIISSVKSNLLDIHDEITNIMALLSSSAAFRKYLTEDEESRTTAEASFTIYSMQKQLENVLKPDTYSRISIVLVGTNAKATYVSSDVQLAVPVEELLERDITLYAKQHPNRITYQFTEKGITSTSKADSAMVAVRTLCYPGTTTIFGYAYLIVPQVVLTNLYKDLSNPSSSLLMMNSKGVVLSSAARVDVGLPAPEVREAALQMERNELPYINTLIKGKEVSVVAQEVPNWNIHLIGIIDRETVKQEVNDTSIVLISVLVALGVILVVFFIIRKTTRPIHTLVHNMHKVTQGEFREHIPVTGSYEVRELSTAFNYMLDGLNSYVEKLIHMEKEKRSSEIHALQMQINPHFMYNTLASIKWLIWQGDMEKSAKAIDAFSMLLRSTISNKKEMITVKEEMENLKNYVFLQHMRFGGQIQVGFFVSDECENCLIPKMLLQPFLENAFFHAFRGSNARGNIHVFISRRGKNLVCEIIDNGGGIPQGKIDEMFHERKQNEHFTGIGIGNVNDRIKLLFGEAYGVSISSRLGKGTVVKVITPLCPMNKGEDTGGTVSESQKNS